MTASPPPPGPPAGGKETPAPPDWSPSHPEPSRHRCGLDRPCLDRLGLTQAIGGGVLGLIALFSSYDHISFAGRSIPIPQQWGIPLIAASVAVIFIDAQLATGSRLRAAQDAARIADETAEERDRAEQRENEADRERNRADQERNRADQERNRADQERNRAAEARERQAQAAQCQSESLERLHQGALLSARVQLDPTDTNRARLRTFLALIAGGGSADQV